MDLTEPGIALLTWLVVVAILGLARPGGRHAVAAIVASLRGKVALILITFTVYIAAVVAAAYGAGLWDLDLLKDTIAWLLVPGMVLLFGFTKAYERGGYYGRTFIRVIGLTALIEFYVNLAAFPLWAELLLLPLLTSLAHSQPSPVSDPRRTSRSGSRID